MYQLFTAILWLLQTVRCSSRSIIQKKMYKGKKMDQSSIIHKSLSSASLIQTTNQVIEREIDNYTRLLEQDKRKFFRVQENRNQVIKQYSKKNKELDLLKSRQFQVETLKLKGEVKILERELDQTINSYNDVLAANKTLKTDIDELRKEKLNQNEVMRKLNSHIQNYRSLISSTQDGISLKKVSIQQSKQQILKIRAQNQLEARVFRGEVSEARGNLGGGKTGSVLFKRKSEMEQKNQATDTQPLVRYRLRNLIAKNKEKVKIIQTYKKTMEAIWKSFEEIKQESGVSDLQEITSTFLKHQQQNHFIYEYIGKLGREIQDLNDSIEQLKQQITTQKQKNQNYAKELGSKFQKQQQKLADCRLQAEYQKRVANLDEFILVAQSQLKQLNGETQLNRFNLTQQLANIQQLIDSHYAVQEQSTIVFHDQATRYTKGPPGIQQFKENRQQRLLDSQKLREFACQFWQKRKGKLELK